MEQAQTMQLMKTEKFLHGMTLEQQKQEARPSLELQKLWQNSGDNHIGSDYNEAAHRLRRIHNKDAHSTSEFSGSWWFTGLDREEQLRVIKTGYLAENTNPIRHDYMESQKVDFCKEDDVFLQFVKEKLL